MTDLRTIHGTLSHEDGLTLTVTRETLLPVEDLWSWVTESDRTARWYGPWSGEGRVGEIVQVTMSQEEGAPTSGMRIEVCERPHRLTLVSEAPDPFAFPLDLECAERDGGSTITLRHRQIPPALAVRELGPGWEYYLDRLVCAIEGRDSRPFEDVMAAQADAYAALRP